MDEDKRRMICDRCRRSVPISDINYLPKGKDSTIALCLACRVKDRKEGKIKVPEEKKKDFYCSKCKYKFKYNVSSQTNLKCPYCGKEAKVGEYKPQSANQIIEEIKEVTG